MIIGDVLEFGGERLSQAILDAIDAQIAVLNSRGEIVAINQSWQRFATENSLDNLQSAGVGANYLDVARRATGPDAGEAQAACRGIEQVLAGSLAHFALEYPCHSPTEHRWFQLRASPLAAGGSGMAVVVHEDISERKRLDLELRDQKDSLYRRAQDLRESSQFNSQIIASVQSGLFVVDRDLRYTLWNPRMEEISGLPAEAVLGKHPLELFPFLREAGIFGLVERALAGESISSPEFVYDVPLTGRKGWTCQTMAPLRSAAGDIVGVIVSVADITEHKRLEEQVRQAQKMEAVGRLAGGIAHDFNNLLTVVLGYCDSLAHSLGNGHALLPGVEQIVNVCQQSAGLTRQLLAISRDEPIRAQVLDLAAVVADSHGLLQRMLGNLVQLKLEAAPTDCRVLADRSQIERVLINLCINARDAMPDGGEVTLRTSCLRGDSASFGGCACVQLEISDTGCGMDEQTRSRVFEPFFTTKPTGAGTGLGLSIVYGIVRQNGGTIAVESTLNQGTTFRILLPCVEAPTTPPRFAHRPGREDGIPPILESPHESVGD